MIKSILSINSLVVGLILAISPLLLIQIQQIWQLWYYRFFPIALGGFVFLVYSAWQSSSSPSPARVVWGKLLSSIAVCLAIVAAVMFSPWLAHAAALIIIASWLLQRLDQSRWTTILSWFLILLTFMPIPLDLHDSLVWHVHWSAGESASHFLDLVGVANFFDGNQLAVGSFSIELDSFKSGFDNIWVVIAVAVFIACRSRLGLVQSFALIASAPFWSWGASTFRILLAALSQEFLGIELIRGWMKESASALVLLLTTLMILVTSRFLAALFHRVPSREEKANTTKQLKIIYNRLTGHYKDETESTSLAKNDSTGIRFYGAMVSICMMIAIIAIYGTYRSTLLGQPNRFLALPSIERVREVIPQSSLPDEMAGMKLVEFELKNWKYPSVLRPEYDAVWRYVSAGRNVVISLRFPLRGVSPLHSADPDQNVLYSKSNFLSISDQAEGFSIPVGLVEETSMKHSVLGDQYSLSTKLNRLDTDRWENSSIEFGSRLSRFAKSLEIQPLGFELEIVVDAVSQDLKDEERQKFVRLLIDCMGLLKPSISSLNDT